MLKLVAILILSAQLSVAVETDNGWSERSFPNTAAGAEQMSDFIEEAIGDSGSGLRVTVGWLDNQVDLAPVIDLLIVAGVKHGVTSADDIRQAAIAHHVPETSAMAVAYADIARFGFIYRGAP